MASIDNLVEKISDCKTDEELQIKLVKDDSTTDSIQLQQRYLVGAGFLSLVCMSSYAAAEQLQIKALTDSATWLGTVLIATRLTQFVVGPISGVFADNSEPRNLLIRLDLLMALVAFMVAGFLAFFDMPSLQIPVIIGSAVLISLLVEIYIPFYSASTGRVFNKEELRRFQSFRTQAAEIARIVGPSFGALLFQMGGLVLAATVNGLGFLVSALFVSRAFSRVDLRPIDAAVATGGIVQKWKSFFQQFHEGIKYIGRQRGMLGFALGAAVTNLFITAQQVSLPFFIKNQMGWDVSWFGYALSALAVGTFVGAWIARMFREEHKLIHGKLILLALPLPGVFWSMIFFAHSPLFMLVCCVLATTAFTFSGVSLLPKVISDTEPRFRGRVFSVLINLVAILTPPGALLAGRLIDTGFMEPRYIFLLSGLCIVLTWVFFLFNRVTRHWVSLKD